MNTFEENNGIYGYENSKVKKQKEMLGYADATATYPLYNNSVSDMNEQMHLGAQQLRESQQRWDNWVEMDRNKALLNSQKEFLVPKNTEERRRRMFVTAPNVVNNALNDYYNDTFKPNLTTERKKADESAMEAYKQYATVPGANPMTALGELNSKSDPMTALDKAMVADDNGVLDKISERYASYAGLDPKEYRRTVLEPALRNRAVGEFIDERTPKSTMEYIGRGTWRNSLMGGLTDFALQGYSRNSNQRFLDDAAMENYKPSRTEQWVAGVGGLLVDAGIFAGIGTGASKLTGATTNIIKKRAVNKLLANGATNGLTREAAEQIVKNSMVNSLSSKIVQSSMTQGLTLGTYDAAHSVVDDLLHGEDINAGNAALAFTKGAATGTMLGTVGTPLRAVSRGLTGGKKLVAATGVLSAESAVFTASTELEKAASGIEIEPIDLLHDFSESTATLLAMRMFHWRPTGAKEKLNTVGRLKGDLRFSLPEADEVAKAGVNPNDFVANVEKCLNFYQKNSEKAQERVIEDYLKLMSNKELSASTRSKLLYIVENKITSTPPLPVDYKIENLGKGNFEFITYDAEGLPIEKQLYSGEEAMENACFNQIGRIRRNRIANSENMLMQRYDSQNFFRQAGQYARETATDVDVISDIMYRKANKESLTVPEENMMNDILQRSNYSDTEVGQMLYEIRRNIENKYKLNEGSLLAAIDKNALYCSPAENEALNAYEMAIENEIKNLYGGTSKERAKYLSTYPGKYSGKGNAELQRWELNDYRVSELNRLYSQRSRLQEIEDKAIEAEKVAESLGTDIEFVRNEDEISVLDPQYRNKIRSLGWYDENKNKIVINLPNNADISEVKKTVVHETVGHKGFAELFGDNYYKFLDEIYARGSKEVRDGIDAQMERNGSFYAGADEYLAMLSERTTSTPEQRNLLQRFHDFVKDMLRRFNIYNSEISENELVSLIQRHHSAMLRQRTSGNYRKRAFTPFETAWSGYGDYRDYGNNGVKNDLPKYRYRYIGEKGATELKDKDRQFLDRLGMAKSMQKRNIPMELIREKTGWEKDEKGSWRMPVNNDLHNVRVGDYVYRSLRLSEPLRAKLYLKIINKPFYLRTDDEKLVLDKYYKMRLPYDDSATLGDIMYEPLFFTAYPSIEKTPVVFSNMIKGYVKYDNDSKKLVVDKSVFAHPDKESIFLSTVQHIVQDYEGMEYVPLNKTKVSDIVKKRYSEAIGYLKFISNLEKYGFESETIEKYKKLFLNDFKVRFEDFKKLYPTVYNFAQKADPLYDYESNESRVNLIDLNDARYKAFLGPLDIIDIKKTLDDAETDVRGNKYNRSLRDAELFSNKNDIWLYGDPYMNEYKRYDGINTKRRRRLYDEDEEFLLN